MSKQELMKRIEQLECLISVYSDRDMVRVGELERELRRANMELLERMSFESELVAFEKMVSNG